MWREDQSQALRGGRRFRCIFSQSPSNLVAFVSFDFKTIKHEVWLVYITRDGLLALLEPSEPESLSMWKELDKIYPFGDHHPRGAEPRFTVSFHQSERPCYSAVIAGVDAKALSFAVSALNSIKIFRATKSDEGNYNFHPIIEMVTAATLINDISWAPGCIRPYDLIAAACDDGFVRIFELNTPYNGDISSIANSTSRVAQNSSKGGPQTSARNAPSGIGAGLIGVSRAAAAARDVAGTSKIKHEWKEVAALPHDYKSAVWTVRWVHDGQCSRSLVFTKR